MIHYEFICQYVPVSSNVTSLSVCLD